MTDENQTAALPNRPYDTGISVLSDDVLRYCIIRQYKHCACFSVRVAATLAQSVPNVLYAVRRVAHYYSKCKLVQQVALSRLKDIQALSITILGMCNND